LLQPFVTFVTNYAFRIIAYLFHQNKQAMKTKILPSAQNLSAGSTTGKLANGVFSFILNNLAIFSSGFLRWLFLLDDNGSTAATIGNANRTYPDNLFV